MWKTLCIAIIVLFCACSKKRAALHYFKNITSYEILPAKLIKKFTASVQQSLSKAIAFHTEAELLEKRREKVIVSLSEAIASLRNAKAFEEDYSLRDGIIAHLEDVKNMYENEWKQVVMYRANLVLTDPDFENIRRLDTELERKRQQSVNTYNNIKMVFANKYQFPLRFE